MSTELALKLWNLLLLPPGRFYLFIGVR